MGPGLAVRTSKVWLQSPKRQKFVKSYFAAVNGIPSTKYLLGLYPLSTRTKRLRCHVVAAAFSCDGVHFSRFLDVAEAGEAGAGRTFAQPVDGWVVEDGLIHVYVQENVLGLAMDRYEDDPRFPTGPPRVVCYSTPIADLIRTAAAGTRGLAGCSAAFAARAAAPPTGTREEKRARRSEDSTPEPRPAGGKPAPPDTTRPPPSDKTAPRSSRRAAPDLLAAVLAFVVFRCCELAFLLYL